MSSRHYRDYTQMQEYVYRASATYETFLDRVRLADLDELERAAALLGCEPENETVAAAAYNEWIDHRGTGIVDFCNGHLYFDGPNADGSVAL